MLWLLPFLATAQVAILHIRVVEGEGAVNVAGSRSSRPLSVEITDETGKPVAGAAVSFQLPESGPSGTFGNGLRTDVLLTDAHGRVTLRNLQFNHTPGRMPIRIVASKEASRAGTIAFQYVADSSKAAVSSPGRQSKPLLSHSRFKWLAMAALAGGGAVAGALIAGRAGNSTVSGTSLSSPQPPTIGSPTISVGKP